MSIQSETACLELLFPLTEPAVWMLPVYKSSFSVRVVLPASGWEMMAKVRLEAISSCMLDMWFLLFAMENPFGRDIVAIF